MISLFQQLILELFALCALSVAVEALLLDAGSVTALRAVFGLGKVLCVVRVLAEIMG